MGQVVFNGLRRRGGSALETKKKKVTPIKLGNKQLGKKQTPPLEKTAGLASATGRTEKKKTGANKQGPSIT